MGQTIAAEGDAAGNLQETFPLAGGGVCSTFTLRFSEP